MPPIDGVAAASLPSRCHPPTSPHRQHYAGEPSPRARRSAWTPKGGAAGGAGFESAVNAHYHGIAVDSGGKSGKHGAASGALCLQVVPEQTEQHRGRSDLDDGGGAAAAGDPADLSTADDSNETTHSTQSIKYRTLSWKRCAAILFGEYVCLAILSFPWAFKTLGLAGGVISTLLVGCFALYTSLTLWRYCMSCPQMYNIADFGYRLFGQHRVVYELTALALFLNNTFIQGLHVLVGSEILSVVTNDSNCSLLYSVIVMLIGFAFTLPRTMGHVALLSMVSAVTMAIAILLVLIFTGIQGHHPEGFNPKDPVQVTVWPRADTTFVQGFNAFLNILFTWVGQICYPTFIAEMERPADFPKALYAVTAMELVLFTIVGVFVYCCTGQYTESPAIVMLQPVFKKISFAVILPSTIIVGVIYASVTAKYLFHRLSFGSRHYDHHTALGWVMWCSCCMCTWVFGWIIGEAVPFFSVLLSLMSALFDGWFGFIFWAAAYREMHRSKLWVRQNLFRKAETCLNVLIALAGLFIFGPGTYTSVQAIIESYYSGSLKAPFTCAAHTST